MGAWCHWTEKRSTLNGSRTKWWVILTDLHPSREKRLFLQSVTEKNRFSAARWTFLLDLFEHLIFTDFILFLQAADWMCAVCGSRASDTCVLLFSAERTVQCVSRVAISLANERIADLEKLCSLAWFECLLTGGTSYHICLHWCFVTTVLLRRMLVISGSWVKNCLGSGGCVPLVKAKPNTH